MASRRARRVSERCLESEYINSTLNGVRRMAVPQLVWVDVEPCGSAPFPADISDGLPCEVPLSAGAREYKRLSFAAAKRLKKLQRVA